MDKSSSAAGARSRGGGRGLAGNEGMEWNMATTCLVLRFRVLERRNRKANCNGNYSFITDKRGATIGICPYFNY